MRSDPSDYDLAIANNLNDAIHLLSLDQGWRPLAGGTDLMVLLNSGKLPFRRLVSVNAIPEMRQIEIADDSITIGAAVTYSQIRASAALQAEFPLLCQAAGWTGGPANQNRGTLGGNVANASPAADSAPMLLVYEAELELSSASGTRWFPYSQFHLGYKQVAMRKDELITRIRLPRFAEHRIQYARKVGTRKAQAISKVCFAAVARSMSHFIEAICIAVGSVAPIPLRCCQTERFLTGCRVTDDLRARAKQILSGEISPITDVRSTDRYRAQVSVNQLDYFLEML